MFRCFEYKKNIKSIFQSFSFCCCCLLYYLVPWGKKGYKFYAHKRMNQKIHKAFCYLPHIPHNWTGYKVKYVLLKIKDNKHKKNVALLVSRKSIELDYFFFHSNFALLTLFCFVVFFFVNFIFILCMLFVIFVSTLCGMQPV